MSKIKNIEKDKSCVKVTASTGDTYTYEISITDEGGAGTGASTVEKDLKRGSFVKSNASTCK